MPTMAEPLARQCKSLCMSERGPFIAVGAIVVREGRLLLVRRGNEPAKGLWSLPGGRLEAGELLSSAVAREVREETGLEVETGELAGVFEVPGEPHYVVLDFIASAPGDDDPVASGDADDARWVELDKIGELECTPRFVETLSSWGVLPSAEEQGD
jgi:8-oxo-dGTP diphosphatase